LAAWLDRGSLAWHAGDLAVGLSLWVIYGLLRHDWVIVCANAVGAGLAGAVLGCKLRDL
jgi:MtN3 and saliva related transmembrane protein